MVNGEWIRCCLRRVIGNRQTVISWHWGIVSCSIIMIDWIWIWSPFSSSSIYYIISYTVWSNNNFSSFDHIKISYEIWMKKKSQSYYLITSDKTVLVAQYNIFRYIWKKEIRHTRPTGILEGRWVCLYLDGKTRTFPTFAEIDKWKWKSLNESKTEQRMFCLEWKKGSSKYRIFRLISICDPFGYLFDVESGISFSLQICKRMKYLSSSFWATLNRIDENILYVIMDMIWIRSFFFHLKNKLVFVVGWSITS